MKSLTSARIGLAVSLLALAGVIVLAVMVMTQPAQKAASGPAETAGEEKVAQTATAPRESMEQIVRSYILENPEIIRDAMVELEKRQQAEQARQQKLNVARLSDDLFSSPNDFVIGNPDGDVTLVEFFDYNCGYCKRALSDLNRLIENDPDLRVVLKEFPILNEGSVEAARLSLAAGPQGKYLEFHRKLLSASGQANAARALRVAEDIGLDIEKMRADAQSESITETITDSMRLASALGINGTPSYVVGEEVVVGAVGYDELKQKIDSLRAEKKKAETQ